MHDAPYLNQRPPPVSPNPTRKTRWVFALVLLLGELSVLTGCEESVDPFIGQDLPFTLWGFLNAGADTQYVRVFPITDHLFPDLDEPLDARVYSTDLTTGELREWTYKRVTFDTLISGHLFWSPFRAVNQHRYRLEVVRSDGETSRVEVTVPSEVDFDIQLDLGSTEIPVEVRGEIPNLVGLRVTYYAVNVPPQNAWPLGTPVAGAVQLPVTIVYDNVIERVGDGWEFTIDMNRDYEAVFAVYSINCLVSLPEESAPDVWLRNMEFNALAADSTWETPDGNFDPNILAVPGTFTNVENGYGFFGAGQSINMDWTPNVTTSLAAGFNFEPKCQGLTARNVPECWNPPVPCVDEQTRDFWQIWLQ